MTTLRAAIPEDAPRIRELVRAAHINPIGLDWQRFVVAANSQRAVIGCGQLKPHQDGSIELASLVVDPDCRGRGIARALIQHLTKIHTGELYLMCRASLGEFYKKFGFEPIPKPEMPPYFRRISRLSSLAEILQKENESLLVMHRPENQATPGSKNPTSF